MEFDFCKEIELKMETCYTWQSRRVTFNLYINLNVSKIIFALVCQSKIIFFLIYNLFENEYLQNLLNYLENSMGTKENIIMIIVLFYKPTILLA